MPTCQKSPEIFSSQTNPVLHSFYCIYLFHRQTSRENHIPRRPMLSSLIAPIPWHNLGLQDSCLAALESSSCRWELVQCCILSTFPQSLDPWDQCKNQTRERIVLVRRFQTVTRCLRGMHSTPDKHLLHLGNFLVLGLYNTNLRRLSILLGTLVKVGKGTRKETVVIFTELLHMIVLVMLCIAHTGISKPNGCACTQLDKQSHAFVKFSFP